MRGLNAGIRLIVLFVIVLMRSINLTADPPSWLSWSSGIYTDEGIYASDARSLALTGHWAPGDFHTMVISPLHSLLLLGLFHFFGVALEPARLLGVVTSVITIALYYFALRRQFDEKMAFVAAFLLAVSPVFIFYNRLALLETPAVCLLVLSYFLSGAIVNQFASGVALALAIIYKPLAFLTVPAFFTDIMSNRHGAIQRAAGLITGLLLYFLVWQLPHASFLGHVNHYYLMHQYLPHSFAGLAHNVLRGVWSGSSDGFLPYMLHHEPLLSVLALSGLFLQWAAATEQGRLFQLWLLVPALAFILISYAPSRYFILVWPALCALGALALLRIPGQWQTAVIVLFGIMSIVAIRETVLSPVYQIQQTGIALASHIPRGKVVAGQFAPEMSFFNSAPSMYVQPGLANSGGALLSDYVVVTDSPYWDQYWRRRLGRTALAPLLALSLPKGQSQLLIKVR